MKKCKSSIELMLEVRKSWTINPRTRVQDNNPKRDIKKQRQKSKKSCRDFTNDLLQDFLSLAIPL